MMTSIKSDSGSRTVHIKSSDGRTRCGILLLRGEHIDTRSKPNCERCSAIREVRIVENDEIKMFFVRYIQRRKHTRHSAAQFSYDVADYRGVAKWIQAQRNLGLLEEVV